MRSADPYRFQKPFEIRVERRGRTVVLCPEGEFDLACKKDFEARLSEILDTSPEELVLDLRELVFIDSTGLRLVLEAWTRSRQSSFEFAVLLPDGDGRVRAVFAETGLDQALPIVEGLPAAEHEPAHGKGNGH